MSLQHMTKGASRPQAILRRSRGLLIALLVAGVSVSASSAARIVKTASVTPAPTVKSLTTCKSKSLGSANVGVLAPVTGSYSADGKDTVDAINLAIKQLNGAGGVCAGSKRIKFKSVVADISDLGSSAVLNGFKLLSTTSNLNVVLASYAATSSFEVTLMAKANMPYLLSGNAAQVSGIISKAPSKYPTVWDRVSNYDEYSTALPKLLEQWGKAGYLPLGDRSVYIIGSDDPYDQGIAKGLQANFTPMGWTITGTETNPLGTVTDWHATLGKIEAHPPTIICLIDYTPTVGAAFQNQFMQKPMNSLVFIQYAPVVPQFLQLTGANANGVLYNQIGGAIPTRKDTNTIEAQFKAATHRTGGYYAVGSYNEMMLYAYCVHKVGDPTNRTAIGKCFGTLNIDAPAGPLKFDPKTHLALAGPNYESIQFYQFQNGQRVLVYPPQYSLGKHVQKPPWFK